jgi:hypothetical protein
MINVSKQYKINQRRLDMSKKSTRLKPKFKVGDIVIIRLLPGIIEKLENCGICYWCSENLLNINGEIIKVNYNSNLPYYVRFDNDKKDCYYLPEDLLEIRLPQSHWL